MSDPSDDAVRRLLAAARHDEPIPTEVADRMDTVIGRLAAERAGGDDREPIPLRRRRLPQLLLAAAAVAAIGFGLGQIATDQDAAESGSGQAGCSVPRQEQHAGDSENRSALPPQHPPDPTPPPLSPPH